MLDSSKNPKCERLRDPVPHNAGSTYLRVFLQHCGDLPPKIGQNAKPGIAGNLRPGPLNESAQCQKSAQCRMVSRKSPLNNGHANTLRDARKGEDGIGGAYLTILESADHALFAYGLGITLSSFHSFYRDKNCKIIKMIKWTSNITGNENMTLDATRRYTTQRYSRLLDAT
jgi:hypothetical protein